MNDDGIVPVSISDINQLHQLPKMDMTGSNFQVYHVERCLQATRSTKLQCLTDKIIQKSLKKIFFIDFYRPSIYEQNQLKFSGTQLKCA